MPKSDFDSIESGRESVLRVRSSTHISGFEPVTLVSLKKDCRNRVAGKSIFCQLASVFSFNKIYSWYKINALSFRKPNGSIRAFGESIIIHFAHK